MKALICCGLKSLPSSPIFQLVPMWRLTERMVRSTLVTAWRLATSPTSTSPFLAKATTDGVVRAPSAFVMTVGSPPSRTLTTEFVVPRSMPTARAIVNTSTEELSFTGSRMHDRPGRVNSYESGALNFGEPRTAATAAGHGRGAPGRAFT